MPRTPKSKSNTNLAKLRVERGFTELQMADLTGISLASYWRLEHNKHPTLPLRALSNCALVLGVDLEALIEDEWREWRVFDKRRPQPPDRPGS